MSLPLQGKKRYVASTPEAAQRLAGNTFKKALNNHNTLAKLGSNSAHDGRGDSTLSTLQHRNGAKSGMTVSLENSKSRNMGDRRMLNTDTRDSKQRRMLQEREKRLSQRENVADILSGRRFEESDTYDDTYNG
jgi:hypothetical protein